LPHTGRLDLAGDLAARMVAGIDAYLDRAAGEAAAQRAACWNRDVSSHARYLASIQPNRERFLRMIGVIDDRESPHLYGVSPLAADDRLADTFPPYAEGNGYRVHAVRWRVLPGVEAAGLLLQPDRSPAADVVALPDCDWTPERAAGLAPGVPPATPFARRLAEAGCRVIVPVLVDRQDTHAGIPGVRMTNQPHREFVHRAAYEFGRYMIGYEVQMVLAAVDWFTAAGKTRPVGVIGYGEGGLIAFYAGAADIRIDATCVSGYFQPRERLHAEPIYRNVFGLLTEFGDAEIAALIAPRTLIVEACRHPEIDGPPPPAEGRSGAAPGRIATPPLAEVEGEYERARQGIRDLHPQPAWRCIASQDGQGPPGSEPALQAMLEALQPGLMLAAADAAPTVQWPVDAEARHYWQFRQWLDHTQFLMREAEFARAAFWAPADRSSVAAWQESSRRYRDYFRDEIIGRLPPASVPLNPRTRLVYETPAFAGYEVMLDVYEEVFAYGILLIPHGIPPEERRPAVVCQHGLEGRPQDVADPAADHPAYHRFACRLAERGYVTYAPQNPYIGGNTFRELVRKAHPIKQSLYGVIVRQHERTLAWLSSLPFVDPGRIAFYGLSYGGKTAMRIPAVLEQYCLSICSADYNEWIWKNVSARHRYSYMITGEYDMPECNLGNTFNYAEMSWLICPRPFMVERGHDDGVAPDEWVAYEYAKTRLHYDKLGIGGRTEMEVFDGPHTINGAGTFAFLDRYLKP
jgi:dienelactone hydrolase